MTTQTNIIRVNVSSYTDTRLHDPALSDAAYRLLHHLLSRPPEEPTICDIIRPLELTDEVGGV